MLFSQHTVNRTEIQICICKKSYELVWRLKTSWVKIPTIRTQSVTAHSIGRMFGKFRHKIYIKKPDQSVPYDHCTIREHSDMLTHTIMQKTEN